MNDQQRQLWQAFAGRGGKKPPQTPADAISTLEAAGAGKREIAQFKKDLAAALGVTVRQVQRMTTRTGAERRGLGRHADAAAQAAANHPSVRQASRSDRRVKRMTNNGARLRIKGEQGPGGHGRSDYKRQRTVERYIDGDVMDRIRDAWDAGDDARAQGIMSEALEDNGYVGWSWDADADVDFLAEHRDS